ncbi:unnamed protein product [Mesocestoides corti]|uniref:Uncharacterized protein n=1 Tax=Mesocestoides corti TaxID=53468 RepID=A0A158QW50_MESCO|nr:unnamed protein product [Mesocestoides corti]
MTSDVQAGGDGRPLEFDVVPVDPNFELPAKLFVDWNVGLYSKLQTLNAEFVGMGHAPCLFKKDSSYVTVHFNAFVTACYALFERYLQNINARETVDENIMRLSIDLEHSRKMHSRCKAELELSQTAVHQGKERERKLEAEKSTLCAQLRASNESVSCVGWLSSHPPDLSQLSNCSPPTTKSMLLLAPSCLVHLSSQSCRCGANRQALIYLTNFLPPPHVLPLATPISRVNSGLRCAAPLDHSQCMTAVLHGLVTFNLHTIVPPLTLEDHAPSVALSESPKILWGYFHTDLLHFRCQIRRMRSDMQHRTTQFQHEVKKREQESLGLKNRLNLLLRGQSQSRCVRSSSAVAGSRKIERLTSSASATTDSTEEHGTLRSQLDLARSMLAHLTSRENDLFYENRELRDLISVLSSRMVRFSRHLKLRRLWRRDVVAVVDADDDDDANDEVEEEEETSLDGVSGDEAVDATNDFSASFSSSSTSSSDEDDVAASGSRRDRRRQSANVHALLLEMPFHMVRDHLTRRVHRLSRRLWREVKAVGASTSPPRVGDDATSEDDQTLLSTGDTSTKLALEEELSRCRLKLDQCERQLKADGLIAVSHLFVFHLVEICRGFYTQTPRWDGPQCIENRQSGDRSSDLNQASKKKASEVVVPRSQQRLALVKPVLVIFVVVYSRLSARPFPHLEFVLKQRKQLRLADAFGCQPPALGSVRRADSPCLPCGKRTIGSRSVETADPSASSCEQAPIGSACSSSVELLSESEFTAERSPRRLQIPDSPNAILQQYSPRQSNETACTAKADFTPTPRRLRARRWPHRNSNRRKATSALQLPQQPHPP